MAGGGGGGEGWGEGVTSVKAYGVVIPAWEPGSRKSIVLYGNILNKLV